MDQKEQKFNTSFIPKKSLQTDVTGPSGDKYVGRRVIHGPGYFLSMMLFLASAVASFALFGYTKIVENSINEKIQLLENQKDSFDAKSVENLIRAETHLNSASTLITNHVAVSQLFELLQEVTLRDVRYTDLSYNGQPGQVANISISGIADSFQDAALQVRQYDEDGNLLIPMMRKLESNQEGLATFSVDMSVDQDFLLFSHFLKNGVVQGANTARIIQESVQTEATSLEEGMVDSDTGNDS